MKLNLSVHTHLETSLNGSTINKMIAKSQELGRTHFSYTDFSYMTGLLKAYDLAKSKNMKFIPGLEILFKDTKCPISRGSASEKSKYFKFTLYATNQESFSKLSELSSKERPNKVMFYGEEHPLWDWSDLESAAKSGLIAATSDIHDIAFKHLLLGREDLAEKTLVRLKKLFGENLYLTVIGVRNDKYFVSLVYYECENGKKGVIPYNSRVSTTGAKNIKAVELVENPKKHHTLLYYTRNFTNVNVSSKIIKAELREGYIPFNKGFSDIKESDLQLRANRFALKMSLKHKIPAIYSDYSFYADIEDKPVQDVRLSSDGIREYTKNNLQSTENAISYLKYLGDNGCSANTILSNTDLFASKFSNFSLSYSYSLPQVEGSSWEACVALIKKYNRLPKSDSRYVERLKKEVSVLKDNGKLDLMPYFLPISSVLDYYYENGELTGPGRGSAPGSLLLYLMGITHVDPIKYGLSFERFQSLVRILKGDMPDVDVDLSSRKLLVGEDGSSGLLYSKWGDRAAQISTRTLLRLKSSIKDVNRYFNGEVDPEIEKLSKSLPAAPQGVSDEDFVFGFEDSDGNHLPGLIEIDKNLESYAKARPEEWDLTQRMLGISRQVSRHASAYIISDRPIKSVVPTFLGGNVTQYEAKAVEKAGLIKYDFLVVNQLKDIELCISKINKKNNSKHKTGTFLHKEKEIFIWDLPHDNEVFKSIWNGDTETLFQVNTASMVPFVKRIKPNSIDDLATILALVRPGPLDFVDEDTGLTMADEYVERRNGKGTVKLKELYDLVPETYGVLVFQEQSSKVAREIGGMSPEDAEELRRIFSKKQKAKALEMAPIFLKGATDKVGEEKAKMIWAQMETSSRYSFNKSHAISYAFITYASMFLKHHYPLEWWSAVLTNADEGEISTVLFKHIRDKVLPPDINLSTNDFEVDYIRNKLRAKLTVLKGLGDSVASKISQSRPYLDIEDFIKKEVAGKSLTKKLIHVGVMDSLFPDNYTLIDKMKAFETALLKVAYEEKVRLGKKVKPPKEAEIDPQYLTMSLLHDFKVKKEILPTMPIKLSDIVKMGCGLRNLGTKEIPMYDGAGGVSRIMVDGDKLLDLETRAPFARDLDFCVPAFVVDSKEFSYKGNTSKALKMILDIDGTVSERVMWPKWGENIVKYPKDLSAGSVVLVFMGIRANKKEANIKEIKILC